MDMWHSTFPCDGVNGGLQEQGNYLEGRRLEDGEFAEAWKNPLAIKAKAERGRFAEQAARGDYTRTRKFDCSNVRCILCEPWPVVAVKR